VCEPTTTGIPGTSVGVSTTGPNEPGGSATTGVAGETTTRLPSSTVCEPADGRLPSTGSGAAPLLLGGVVLFAGGLGALLAGRSRSAD
jgi:LPXTG-motif cell wall-anchored protein